MSVEIYDNFLPTAVFKNIQEVFMGPYLSWYYNPTVVLVDGDNSISNFQFTHSIYTENRPISSIYDELIPLFKAMKIYSLIRVKANLITFNGCEQYEHGMHTDVPSIKSANIKTAVFYINSNDGYTKIKRTGQKIQSVENRLVVFDYTELHTGSSVTDNQVRVALNINYIEHD